MSSSFLDLLLAVSSKKAASLAGLLGGPSEQSLSIPKLGQQSIPALASAHLQPAYEEPAGLVPTHRSSFPVPIPEPKLSTLSRIKLGLADIYKKSGSKFMEIYNTFREFSNSRVANYMTPEEKEFRERIFRNITPVVYEGASLGRIQAVAGDSGRREGWSNKVKEHGSFGIREDLFRRYLGLEPLHQETRQYIRSSRYRPSQERDPSSNYIEFVPEKLIQEMRQSQIAKSRWPESGYVPALPAQSFGDLMKYVGTYNRLPPTALTANLGVYKAYVGTDQKSGKPYVSYYDLWDLDPPELKAMGLDLDQFNFPFEIYGRIYESDFDKAVKER